MAVRHRGAFCTADDMLHDRSQTHRQQAVLAGPQLYSAPPGVAAGEVCVRFLLSFQLMLAQQQERQGLLA